MHFYVLERCAPSSEMHICAGRGCYIALWVSVMWKVALCWLALSVELYISWGLMQFLPITSVPALHVCTRNITWKLFVQCITILMSHLSAVHIHPDPSGGADSCRHSQQACLDVGRWNGGQWPGGLYWEWGCLDQRACRSRRGSAGHGPRPVSLLLLNQSIWIINSLANFSNKEKLIFRADGSNYCILNKYSLDIGYSSINLILWGFDQKGV